MFNMTSKINNMCRTVLEQHDLSTSSPLIRDPLNTDALSQGMNLNLHELSKDLLNFEPF